MDEKKMLNESDKNITTESSTSFASNGTPIVSTPMAKRKRKFLDSAANFGATPPYASSTLNETRLAEDLHSYCQLQTPEKNPFKRFAPSPKQDAFEIVYSEGIRAVRRRAQRSGQHTSNLIKQHATQPGRLQILQNAVLKNHLIMEKVFGYLSDGDLYRFSSVTGDFQEIVESIESAGVRFRAFLAFNNLNKENYVITPPASPPSKSPPPKTCSDKLNQFIEVGRTLAHNQTLRKCRSCEHLAIVENSICQCQSSFCGLIYCLQCSSFSKSGPESFVDKCGNSVLGSPLLDRTNNSNNLSKCDSGVFSMSENEVSSHMSILVKKKTATQTAQVKRKLFGNISNSTGSNSGMKQLFSIHNRYGPPSPKKRVTRLSYNKVIPMHGRKKIDEISPPNSPVRNYTACSIQSKRNLKRLTR